MHVRGVDGVSQASTHRNTNSLADERAELRARPAGRLEQRRGQLRALHGNVELTVILKLCIVLITEPSPTNTSASTLCPARDHTTTCRGRLKDPRHRLSFTHRCPHTATRHAHSARCTYTSSLLCTVPRPQRRGHAAPPPPLPVTLAHGRRGAVSLWRGAPTTHDLVCRTLANSSASLDRAELSVMPTS